MDLFSIYSMLDWNNSEPIQQKGLVLAKQKPFEFFIQPIMPEYDKNIWDNCAIVVSRHSDADLQPYLYEIMRWTEDLNWPGAERILRRLKQYEYDEFFKAATVRCLEEAKDNTNWTETIVSLQVAKKDLLSFPQIIRMININRPIIEQNNGIKRAREINNIDVFLQPCFGEINEDTWENCSRIIAERDDGELSCILFDLFNWIRSIDTPGAANIMKRLREYKKDIAFELTVKECLRQAKAICDSEWINNMLCIG